MKNVYIMGVRQFLGEEGHKKRIYIYGEQPEKGLGQFAEGLAKNKEEGAFEGEGVDIWMHTMT